MKLNILILTFLTAFAASNTASSLSSCYVNQRNACSTGSTVSGEVVINADNGYDIQIDGSYVGTDFYNWNTNNYSNGNHRIEECTDVQNRDCSEQWFSDYEWVSDWETVTTSTYVSDFEWVSDWECDEYDDFGDCVDYEDDGYYEDDSYTVYTDTLVDEGDYEDEGNYQEVCTTSNQYLCYNTYQVNVQNISTPPPPPPPPPMQNNYGGLWWNPNESGWGVTLANHGPIIVATMFSYDAAGNADWYIVSNCPLIDNGCTGDLYHVAGGKPLTSPWSGAAIALTKVGNATLTFSDANSGVMMFTVNGVTKIKTVQRDVFATTPLIGSDHTDMWWNSNESGWGTSVVQEGATIFAAIYTYSANGTADWVFASNCPVVGSQCTSTLYRTHGGSPLTSAWNGSALTTTPVGSMNFNFTDPNNAIMTFSVDGVSGIKNISRMAF